MQSLTIATSEGLVRLQRQDIATSDESDGATEEATESVWMIIEPETGPADETTVKGILSALKNVQSAEPADPSDLAALGLEPPNSFIEGELEDGSTFLIQFGLDTELAVGGDGVYARVAAKRSAAIIRSWVRDSLLKELDTLRATPPEPEPAPEPAPEPTPEPIPEPVVEPQPDSDG